MPFALSTVTRTDLRGSRGRAFGGVASAVACFTTAARARAAIGFASSAVPATTRPTSSSVAIPAATTAIVRQEWRVGFGKTCSTGSIGFAACLLDPSTAAPEVVPVEVRDDDRPAGGARRREHAQSHPRRLGPAGRPRVGALAGQAGCVVQDREIERRGPGGRAAVRRAAL